MPASTRVITLCIGLAVTFEIALVFRKVKSKAIIPDANMMIMMRETSRASDSMVLIVL
jgi:hypothetical protein